MDSIKDDADTRNIALLAANVVHGTLVKPTLGLYMRLALLVRQFLSFCAIVLMVLWQRWHVVHYNQLAVDDGDKWWKQVDLTLVETAKQGSTMATR